MGFVNPELFGAFLAAVLVIIVLPGPTVTLVVANSVAYGTRSGFATVAGTASGNALLLAIGAIGLDATMDVVANLLYWLRWVGVVYLAYLGLREWQAVLRPPPGNGKPTRSARGAYGQGMLVAATNPETIFFFAAFYPQFLDPKLADGPQLAAMSVASVLLAGFTDGIYAVLAGRLRGLALGERHQRLRRGITGTLFICTALGIALARRG